MKIPNTKLNTHGCMARGLQGIKGHNVEETYLELLVTVDEYGETFSINNGETIFICDGEPLQKLFADAKEEMEQSKEIRRKGMN